MDRDSAELVRLPAVVVTFTTPEVIVVVDHGVTGTDPIKFFISSCPISA